MTYQEAIRYLDSFVNYEKEASYDYKRLFSLDRMRRLASMLGDPQDSVKSIHIAGTKGKGSTSAIIHSILKEANFSTGLYTSPHLVSFRERIRIGDRIIGKEDIARLMGILKKAVEKLRPDTPTFFEVCTMLAYLYFREKKADFAVYETGLGGRLDATNILKPLVSAITPISYEHMDKLGKTLPEIATEKAGIIKDGGICVVAPQEEEALETISWICKEKSAKRILVGKDIKFKELAFSDTEEVFCASGPFNDYPSLEMPLLGEHQVVNAATAIGVIEALELCGITIDRRAVKRGLKKVKWPGRLEVISRRPLVILDGAQNRASACALAAAIKRAFGYRKLVLVLGISKDKDIKGILDELLPISDKIVLTKANIAERAADPSAIKELIKSRDGDIYLTKSVGEAIVKARRLASKDDLILVTGSLFVVGEAGKILDE